ncbi:DUF3021 domain-containing protein [Streptococcus chenjunshii]|uniref:DUF3021 domain-containing protein n=1 Tax=Streptococcus chenjunshii TaxID=2173853 RepID=A0A372KJA1_9STRE|nr:DUF3021 domain-containing protein [Streptococcus chenjunshii]AXQ78130.1 DUF3021 domain-containing protein [Streptococcus chenjunshii]RFU50168.1 DUF3021 domain-containing protein [Streptococcus chenjunshii]RFU52345.1 DUF3021 domain-containing protein [Streptococcus chenjunshii]
MKTRWQRIFSKEVAIEYKTGTYSMCALVFMAFYQCFQKSYSVSVFYLLELVFVAYFLAYLQVYLFHNFDEAEKLSGWELSGIFISSCLYGLCGQFLGWFDRHWGISIFFALFMAVCYLSVFVANKKKRYIDSQHLNQLLETYKERKRE